MSVQFSSV